MSVSRFYSLKVVSVDLKVTSLRSVSLLTFNIAPCCNCIDKKEPGDNKYCRKLGTGTEVELSRIPDPIPDVGKDIVTRSMLSALDSLTVLYLEAT